MSDGEGRKDGGAINQSIKKDNGEQRTRLGEARDIIIFEGVRVRLYSTAHSLSAH